MTSLSETLSYSEATILFAKRKHLPYVVQEVEEASRVDQLSSVSCAQVGQGLDRQADVTQDHPQWLLYSLFPVLSRFVIYRMVLLSSFFLTFLGYHCFPAKLIIIAKNCPALMRSEIEYYAMLAKTDVHHYNGFYSCSFLALFRFHVSFLQAPTSTWEPLVVNISACHASPSLTQVIRISSRRCNPNSW